MEKPKYENHFKYLPEKGIVVWVTNRQGGVKKGDRAGYLNPNGYRYIKFQQKLYAEHRLIWRLVYGYFPEEEIDHIDRNKSNNVLSNLRLATRLENARNRGISKNNVSGHTGVCFRSARNKWQAYIGRKNLGYFDSKQAAINRRKQAEHAR